MANIVRESLASSSAHGISRAAATNSLPLRVAWSLLFLLFFGLFCNHAVTLIKKLANVNAVTTVQMDKVPFEEPDVYVCPSNTISGSFPYSLSESEAAMVNDEVERLGRLFDELVERPELSSYKLGRDKIEYILNSLNPKVMKLLIWRSEQSVVGSVGYGLQPMIYSIPHCTKLKLNVIKRPLGGYLIVQPTTLFTDPYNPHLNYTGSTVKPIVQNNKTVELSQWDFQKFSGFTLVFMTRDTMPIVSDSSLWLAPGQYYNIKLGMEKVVFSEEFHGKNCSPSDPNLEFLDRLSGDKLEYRYSFTACFGELLNRIEFATSRRVQLNAPIPWDLRNSSQYGTVQYLMRNGSIERSEKWLWNMIEDCRRRQPCEYHRYVASYSAFKWPDFRGKYSWLFENIDSEFRRPAIDKLAMIATQLDAGNHSSEHLIQELELRNFLTSSFLRFFVVAHNPQSPLLTIEPSYSWTAFMSDIGGLLGLYIGCSLLTLCELLELLFHAVSRAVSQAKSGRPEGPKDAGQAAAMPDGAAMDDQITKDV